MGYFFAILFWTPRPPRNPPWCPRLNILPAAQASSAGGVLQSKAMEDCGVGGCVLKRPLQEQRASRMLQEAEEVAHGQSLQWPWGPAGMYEQCRRQAMRNVPPSSSKKAFCLGEKVFKA